MPPMVPPMVISRLSEHETGDLIEALSNHGSTPVLIAYDATDDAFKFKIGGHWGPPLGTRDDGYGNAPLIAKPYPDLHDEGST